MKKVHVVTVNDPESSMIVGVFTTEEKAREAWDEARRRLLSNAKYLLERREHTSTTRMLEEEVQNLSCEDPSEIDNWPPDTPKIGELEVDKVGWLPCEWRELEVKTRAVKPFRRGSTAGAGLGAPGVAGAATRQSPQTSTTEVM